MFRNKASNVKAHIEVDITRLDFDDMESGMFGNPLD